LAAAVISLAAFLVAAIQPISSFFARFSRPQVTIQYPSAGMHMPNNTFGARGTEQHIPLSSDLWLVVRSGVEGRWYPVINLTISNGKWSINSDWICPASGLQDIQVYLVPNTDEEALFNYVKGGKHGISSLPPGAVLEATHAVNIASKSPANC
jgi:hypothetical protein